MRARMVFESKYSHQQLHSHRSDRARIEVLTILSSLRVIEQLKACGLEVAVEDYLERKYRKKYHANLYERWFPDMRCAPRRGAGERLKKIRIKRYPPPKLSSKVSVGDNSGSSYL